MSDLGNKEVFSKNLLYYMKINDKDRNDISRDLDIPYTTVTSWCNGEFYPRIDKIELLSRYFDIEKSDLIENKSYNDRMKTKGIRVPVLGRIPAGIPIEAIEEVLDYEEIPIEMTRGGKEYFGLKIVGDSMYPEYLEDDVLIILKQDDCENGDDCVVMVNGNDATFKRVYKNTDSIILQPLNNAYPPMIYNNKQIEELPVKILGIVDEIRRKKRKK